MYEVFGWMNTIPRILALIAHLAGLIVAIILLVRKKGTPAILATVAFGLLFLMDVGLILRTAFLDTQLLRSMGDPVAMRWTLGGLNCCCGLFDIIGIVCLIVALWQAIGGGKAAETFDEEAPELYG